MYQFCLELKKKSVQVTEKKQVRQMEIQKIFFSDKEKEIGKIDREMDTKIFWIDKEIIRQLEIQKSFVVTKRKKQVRQIERWIQKSFGLTKK